MQITFRYFAFGAMLCSLATQASAASRETISGEVISINCYIQNTKNIGKTGRLCALADVKWEGNSPGLLTRDGKVYQLIGPIVAENNAKLVPYLGQTITISGEVTSHDGMSWLSADELVTK